MVNGQATHDVGTVSDHRSHTGSVGSGPRGHSVIDEIGKIGLRIIRIGHEKTPSCTVLSHNAISDKPAVYLH